MLTGASTERIKAAVRLLEDGKGQPPAGLRRQPRGHPRGHAGSHPAPGSRLYNCCVDLGFKAADTNGNAREIAAWAKTHSYNSLIVVTADYHMPRAMLELRGAMPGVELIAYPVKTDALDAGRWWRDQPRRPAADAWSTANTWRSWREAVRHGRLPQGPGTEGGAQREGRA